MIMMFVGTTIYQLNFVYRVQVRSMRDVISSPTPTRFLPKLLLCTRLYATELVRDIITPPPNFPSSPFFHPSHLSTPRAAVGIYSSVGLPLHRPAARRFFPSPCRRPARCGGSKLCVYSELLRRSSKNTTSHANRRLDLDCCGLKNTSRLCCPMGAEPTDPLPVSSLPDCLLPP